MPSFHIKGKIYDTDHAIKMVALNQSTERYEDPWYEGKHGVRSFLWLSYKLSSLLFTEYSTRLSDGPCQASCV